MISIRISLSKSLKSFVDERAKQRGYGTSSEYVRELIRKEQDRLQLRSLLLAEAASAPTKPIYVTLNSTACERKSAQPTQHSADELLGIRARLHSKA